MAASNTRFTQNSLGQSKTPIDSDHGIYRDRRDFITVLNNPIVRIPRELIAPASHLPIERRQKNVAQQRRGYPALWRPSFRREEPTLSVTARQ